MDDARKPEPDRPVFPRYPAVETPARDRYSAETHHDVASDSPLAPSWPPIQPADPTLAPTRPLHAVSSLDTPTKKRVVTSRVVSGRRTRSVMSTALTLLLLLAVNMAVQLNRRTWDIRSDPLASLGRVQACESLGLAPDVVYLGSSRTLHNIDPLRVDTVIKQQESTPILSCNLGADGSSFEQDYYVLKRFLEDGYTPKVIVETLWEYNLLPSAYGANPTHLEPSAQIPWLADAKDVSTLQGASQAHLASPGASLDFLASKTIALYGDRNGLHDTISYNICKLAHVTKCDRPVDWYARSLPTHGWVPLTGRNIVTNPPSGAGCGNTCKPLHLMTDGYEVANLQKLIQLAEQRYIRVVLIVPPITDRQRANYGPYNWGRILSFWQAFARQNGARYYDVNVMPALTPSDFYDPMHLDQQGAEIFSTWLATHVIWPALSSLPGKTG